MDRPLEDKMLFRVWHPDFRLYGSQFVAKGTVFKLHPPRDPS